MRPNKGGTRAAFQLQLKGHVEVRPQTAIADLKSDHASSRSSGAGHHVVVVAVRSSIEL